MRIAPSILDADFTNISAEIESLKTADRIHLDIMDGHYVPNLSFGPLVLKNADFPIPTEAHLMVERPENFFDMFIGLGVQGITFHIENTGEKKALELLKTLKNHGIRTGISIDGHTEPDALSDEILRTADQVLVMSVKAGKGGQSFMPEAAEKIKTLRNRGFEKEIEVDGGVDTEKINLLKNATCDICVVGSFLMKKSPTDRASIIQEMQNM